MTMNIRSVRPKAYRVLKAAGLKIESSRAGARPTGFCGGGVTVLHGPRLSARGFSGSGERVAYLARAVAALRAAGWTVDDDGTIRAVPGGE